jgi:hypothetical protein
MKTMKKLQVAAAAASLFAVAGVAQAATLNSSGSVIAAETIFPTATNATLGNNTKIKAPTFTYTYEGGVNAQSRQIFKIAVNLVGGAQWARDQTRVGDALVPFFQTDGRQAASISAVATVSGVRGRVAVLNAADPGPGQFAVRLNRIEAGDTIQGSPLVSSALSAVTYVFEVVNNTQNATLNLEQLALTFSTFKPAGAVMLANSAPDTVTTNLDQYPTIYNLAALSVDTNNPATCVQPTGAIRLQAVSGNNDPAVLSQEDTTSNQGTLRDVGNYILIRRATDVTLAKAGDRLVQTTNSYQTNLLGGSINGVGGTGGGRFTFKPSTTDTANVYGGTQTGIFAVDNTRDVAFNTTFFGAGAVGAGGAVTNQNQSGTSPERRTSGDERAARLGTLTFGAFAGAGNALDRLLDLDTYSFKPGTAAQLPNNASSEIPSDFGNPPVVRQVGDFTNPVNPNLNNNGNVYGGVDINTVVPNATPLSGAVVIQFTSKPNFSGFAKGAGGAVCAGTTCGLSLQRGGNNCADVIPAASLGGSLIEAPAGSGNYFWRFSHAELAAASLPAPAGFATGTLAGPWSVCYNVTGEVTIPSANFTNVSVSLLKDDTTEQPIVSCTASLASIYGGVKVDVRNFQLQAVPQVIAANNLGADESQYFGVLRLINNSEFDTATVEGQFIHEDGRYGPWGTLATLAPRAATSLLSTAVYNALNTPVANPTAEVNNARPTLRTTRVRVSADVSTLRVQNYVFNARFGVLAEISSAQGADFVNVDSSNRDHIDQDAQFDIVKDGGTLTQRQNAATGGAGVPKAAINVNP